ncbi:polyprenyl synthetase family protein [Loigolactobacillus iwatensis]|uniref:polyprenyl synthetase family protein n=1 Tax=Loigolactobacillus iwatensis TaxID=1267156 RepID=UPI000F7DBBE5|nr:farnesyl diphosphate synthase [Loigolactobacillus iwatensis]
MTTKLTRLTTEMVPALDSLLTMKIQHDVPDETLQSAMTYSVMAGGKRLRPLLLLATVQTFLPGQIPQSLQAAAAIELVHTYSLIHDDLPAMDNDDLRRGKPTNHVKFGEAQAILAGDGLLTLAFQWLSDCQLAAEVKVALVHELALGAGPAKMVAGQSEDIAGEARQLTLPQLQALHEKKTGALIKASILMGADIAGVQDYRRDALTKYAVNLGLAFQIRDDILDVTSTAEELGKPVHQDEAAHKNTYPGLLGLAGAKDAFNKAIAATRLALDPLVASTDITLFEDFADYLEK